MRAPSSGSLWAQLWKKSGPATPKSPKKNPHQAPKAGKIIRSAYAGGQMSYDKIVREGYEGNVIVCRCISQIAKAVGSVQVDLCDTFGTLVDHPFAEVIKEPSQGMSWSLFMEELVTSYLLTGNAYVELVGDPQGQPVWLNLLRPDRVAIKPGSNGLPACYLYRVDGQEHRVEVDPITHLCPILHIKNWNPLSDWYGMSPLQSASKAIDMHNAVGIHNLALLRHGGRPSGAIIIKPTPEGEMLTEEDFNAFKSDIRDFYEGEDNAGRMLLLEGNFEWKEMGLSPKSMDFIEGKLLAAREIAQAFGVPSMLVGIPGDSTFSNYREARYHLWEETVLPLLDHILNSFTHGWVQRYGAPHMRLTYDLERIHALAPRRERKWERFANATFLTINEKRAAFGYPPVLQGDAMAAMTEGSMTHDAV